MIFFIKLIAIVAMMVVVYFSVNIRVFSSYLNSDYMIAILFVQPLIIVSLFFSGMRLSILATVNSNNAVSFCNGFKTTIISYGIGLALPLRLSEFLKPVYLKKQCGISLSAGLAAVVLERISDIVILTIFAIVGAVFFLKIDYSFLLLAFCIMALFIVLVFLFEYYFIGLFEVRFTKIWQKFAFSIVKNIVTILKNKSTYIGFFFGLIAWLISFSSVILYFKILGVSGIGLDGYLAVFLGSIIGGAVPALPGGFGMYEASVVYILGKYGYGFDQSIILAIGLHVSQLIFSILASIYLSLFGKLGISSIITEIRSLSLKGSNNSKI